jgi:hypothetical protein
MANFQLADNFKVPITLSPVDADGNPASLPAGNVPVWSTSDPTMATVVADPTGLVGTLSGAAKLGTVQVTAVAQALPDSTTPTFQASVDIVAGGVASLSGAFGTPVKQ